MNACLQPNASSLRLGAAVSWSRIACLQPITISSSSGIPVCQKGRQWGAAFWFLGELEPERLPTAKQYILYICRHLYRLKL